MGWHYSARQTQLHSRWIRSILPLYPLEDDAHAHPALCAIWESTLAVGRRIFPGATEDPVPLSGKWKVTWTIKSPSASKATKPPAKPRRKYLSGAGDEAAMEEISLPGRWARSTEGLGEVVFLRHFELPDTLTGQDLTLNLGKINARDEVFVSGVKVGGVGSDVKNFWVVPRKYTVPAKVVKAGDNLVVVRLRAENAGWDFPSAPAPRDIGPANPKDTRDSIILTTGRILYSATIRIGISAGRFYTGKREIFREPSKTENLRFPLRDRLDAGRLGRSAFM